MKDNLTPPVLAPANPWQGETELLCVGTRMETADVCSFFFKCEKAGCFDYKPGQFITLEVPVKDETILRTYTISATPTRPHLISITVKRVPDGVISNHLHDWLKPGMSIKATPPGGIFTFIDYDCRKKFLFLSGGSGITPLMSMSRYIFDLRWTCDIVFCHSARTPDDVIFAKELAMMENSLPSFQTKLYCDRVTAGSNWQGGEGFLTADSLSKSVPDLLEREIFCCGPAPYMDNLCKLLKELNYDMEHYHQESFTFDTVAEEAPDQLDTTISGALAGKENKDSADTDAETSPDTDAKASPDKGTGNTGNMGNIESIEASSDSFKVTFGKLGKTIECGADKTILAAGKAAGLILPFGCSQGICGTCKSKKVSGEVMMHHQGGIRESEIANGYILPCCSKPLTDIELE